MHKSLSNIYIYEQLKKASTQSPVPNVATNRSLESYRARALPWWERPSAPRNFNTNLAPSKTKSKQWLNSVITGPDVELDTNRSLDPYRAKAKSMHWWDRAGSNVGAEINNFWHALWDLKFRPSRDSSVGKYQPSLAPGQTTFSPYFNNMRDALEEMDKASYNFSNSGWAAEDYAPAAKQYMTAVARFKQQLDVAKANGQLSPAEANAIYKMYQDSLGRAKEAGLVTNSAIVYNENGNKVEIVPEAILSDLATMQAESYPTSGRTQDSLNLDLQKAIKDDSLSPEEKKQKLEDIRLQKVHNNLDEYNRILDIRNNTSDPAKKEQFNQQLNALVASSYNDMRRLVPSAPELQPAIAQLYQRAKKDNLSAADQIFRTEMADYNNRPLSQGQRIGGYEKWKSLISNPESGVPSYHKYLKSVGQSNPYQKALYAKNDMDVAHSYFKNKDGSYNYNLSWRIPNSAHRSSTTFVITDADKKIMDQFESEPERRLWYADKYMRNIPEGVRNNFLAGTTRRDNLYRSPNNGKLIRLVESDEDLVERNRKTKSLVPDASFKTYMTNWDK